MILASDIEGTDDMHKLKRWLVLGAIPLLTVVLTACKRTTTTTLKPPTGFFGIFYKWVGLPLQHLMDWIAPWFGKASGYGIAIILITLAVRLILLPAMLRQQKNMTISQEKMKVLKPQLDIIQAQMKKASSQEETLRLNQLMQDVYKKNGTSMLPSMGCLTLLIQLPIFSGLYQAVAYSPEISTSKFFGIALGQNSMVITIVATLIYLVQSWIMVQGVDASQRKAMQTTALMSPIMTFFFCMFYNAGLGLYFLAGGIMIVIQQVIVTYVMTPRIRKQIDEEIKGKPPVIVVDEHTFDQGVIAQAAPAAGPATAARPTTPHSGHGRNAGKQRHH